MAKDDRLSRIVVRAGEGEILLFDPQDVFYFEARDDDTVVRTSRRTLYRTPQRLRTLAARLPVPLFFRCHESYVVNLARVRLLKRRGRDWLLGLDPPVNKLIPVARSRWAELRRLLGAP